MIGEIMKFVSVIVSIVFIIMLIKGAIESGWLTIAVLSLIILSLIKKNKKKKRYSKKSHKSYVKTSNKKNNVNFKTSFNDININSNDYKSQYKNEPINQTEKFIKDNAKLTKLRQMKAISNDKYVNSISKLFYLQATFMKDFTDDYEINVPLKKYTPTYNDLNIYQLRSYFSWRTLIRNGIYHKTELSYVYLYIYELLNKIGAKNSIDGINKLIEFWHKYRKYDDSIDAYLVIWIKDYYVINNIKIDYKLVEKEYPIVQNNKNQFINEVLIGDYKDKSNFYDEISNYHILNSKFMEHKYCFLINLVITDVFKNLDKLFHEYGYSFNVVVFGTLKKNTWIPFRSAIYYDSNDDNNFCVTIDNYEKYYKTNGQYYKEEFVFSDSSKYVMGYILKNIEITLRECLKFSKNLKISDNMLESIKQNDNKLYQLLKDEKFNNVINTTIKKYLIEHKNEINNIVMDKKKQNIVIDLEKFDDIRKSSNRVQEKLVIEEESKIEEKMINEENKNSQTNIIKSSENIFVNLISNLNEIETQFLKKIIDNINKDNLIEYCKKNNILYEIMVENINSKSLDTIGDNLIEDCGNEIIIYDEYLNSIKENIGGI